MDAMRASHNQESRDFMHDNSAKALMIMERYFETFSPARASEKVKVLPAITLTSQEARQLKRSEKVVVINKDFLRIRWMVDCSVLKMFFIEIPNHQPSPTHSQILVSLLFPSSTTSSTTAAQQQQHQNQFIVVPVDDMERKKFSQILFRILNKEKVFPSEKSVYPHTRDIRSKLHHHNMVEQQIEFKSELLILLQEEN